MMNLLLTCLILFFGFLIQAVSGFGAGLFSVPLLSLIHEPRAIVPVFVLTVWMMNVAVAWETRRHIVWSRVAIISGCSLLSVPIGVHVLAHLDQNVLRLLISSATSLLGLFFLLGLQPRLRDTPATLMIAGLVSGLLSGSAAMGGPPLIIMGYSLGWGKDEFRATLLTCFAVSGTASIVFFWGNGLLHAGNASLVPAALVPTVAAMICGIRIKNKLNQRCFRRLILVLIVAVGAAGVVLYVA